VGFSHRAGASLLFAFLSDTEKTPPSGGNTGHANRTGRAFLMHKAVRE